jgi:uncharacterized protein with PQ loop repeat
MPRKSKLHQESLIVTRWLTSIAAVLGPCAEIPQLIEVYRHSTDGVSTTTWMWFLSNSTIWCIYSILNRRKILLVQYSLFVIFESLIVIRLLVGKL